MCRGKKVIIEKFVFLLIKLKRGLTKTHFCFISASGYPIQFKNFIKNCISEEILLNWIGALSLLLRPGVSMRLLS